MFKFIEAKLRPPDLRPTLIKRDRLLERLHANLGLSATLVCAGPGWGKTTVAAEFINSLDRPFVWYDVDRSDADIAVFLQYFVRAIGQAAPGFGQNTLDMLAAGAGARPEQVADLFLYELSEEVEDNLVIVLDNVHHVFAADWSAALLSRLLELLPANLHLLLLARVVPEYTFSRARSKQIMERLDDRALAFTRAEATGLLGGALDDPEAIDKLLGWTQGWVAGLQIIRQALEADPRLHEQDITRIMAYSEQEIFDYFADKVYRANPPEVRRVLACSALARHITPEILGEALNLAVSREQIGRLARENTFLSRVAGEADTFVYHPLFHNFLRKQLEEETTAEERARMHQGLGRYYAARASWPPAIEHFLEAADQESAALSLLQAQPELLAGGLTLTASSYFPRFSRATLDAHPQLYNLMGDMHEIAGDTANAEAMFRLGVAASRQVGDAQAEAAACAGLAHVAARCHNFKDAIRLAEQAAKGVVTPTAALAARIKNVVGAVRAFEGRYAEATSELEEALRLAREGGDARLLRTIAHNLALPAYLQGDFRAALRYFSHTPIGVGARYQVSGVGEQDPAPGTRHLSPDSIALYLNRAAIYTAMGEMEKAEQDLNNAAEVVAVFNLRGFLPHIYEGRANLAREWGQFDEADRLYDYALNECRQLDSDPVKTDLYYERGLLDLRRGTLDRGLKYINLMIADCQKSGREIEEALARQMRCRILVEMKDAGALADAEASEPLIRRLQCNYYLAIGCYLKARLLAERDPEGGRNYWAEFLRLAERFDYGYFVACEQAAGATPDSLRRLYGASSEWLERVIGDGCQVPGDR